MYIHSDRPRVYENQSDLPPNPFSLEKMAAGRVVVVSAYHTCE